VSSKRTRKELLQIQKSATATLKVSIAITLGWLFIYNLVAYEMSPLLAFFKILDGINDVVVGMLTVSAIGLGIAFIFTVTNLFTQTMTNLYSMRMIEDLIREHLFKREYRTFFYKLVHFDELPKPESPFPRYISSGLMAFAYYYSVSWFYLVVFSECLYFAAWSAGVVLPFYPENMHIIPLFAIAVPFTARLMAYVKYPYAQDYASFIPGILFVVVLLLAFAGYMDADFQFLMEDIYKAEEIGYFARGALFWKFLKDGIMIAFYPVFGEVVFYYLMYQDLQEEIKQTDEEEAYIDEELFLEQERMEEATTDKT